MNKKEKRGRTVLADYQVVLGIFEKNTCLVGNPVVTEATFCGLSVLVNRIAYGTECSPTVSAGRSLKDVNVMATTILMAAGEYDAPAGIWPLKVLTRTIRDGLVHKEHYDGVVVLLGRLVRLLNEALLTCDLAGSLLSYLAEKSTYALATAKAARDDLEREAIVISKTTP
ncbi:MAG: hypothetical protein LBL84_00630 [Candidatus Nomurabacteria bacterium]|nr:hypothetical protein [Candidatus Nomurabacteria bacterium]